MAALRGKALIAYRLVCTVWGSTYLFIRGMIGPDTPVIDGERCGVARWLPPAEMVVRLSQLFDGEAS